MYLNGMRVIETMTAVQGHPVKSYPKRKAKTEAHWRRMRKKWIRRYGMRWEPVMFVNQTAGILYVHPALMPKLREAIETQACVI